MTSEQIEYIMDKRASVAGLDFGMTNSLLCYHEQGKDDPIPFRPKGGVGYAMPTIVVRDSIMGRLIGKAARTISGYAENFKISLSANGLSSAEREKGFEATRQFLGTLLSDLHPEGGGKDFKHLVVTIPEAWYSGDQQAGQETLRKILESLGVGSFELLSEPVAAACYFAYRHAKETGHRYSGHVLVYDHGGSTLDLNLARVTGSWIHSVSGIGLVGAPNSMGFGGVEFDRRVKVRISTRSDWLRDLCPDDQASWLHDFEHLKCENGQKIESMCKAPDKDRLLDTPVFKVHQTQVLLRDLLKVFDDTFASKIRADVLRVLDHAGKKEEIAIKEPSRFRIVAVGGFSEFYPVQQLIEGILKEREIPAGVLQAHMSRDDKWLAVAAGASLYASDTIKVNKTCPFEFGVVSYLNGVEQLNPLMRRDDPLETYEQPNFLHQEFGLNPIGNDLQKGGDNHSLIFYVDRAGEPQRKHMKPDFAQSLPDFSAAEWWHVGILLHKGSVLLLLRSNTGVPKAFRMGEVFSMVDERYADGIIDG